MATSSAHLQRPTAPAGAIEGAPAGPIIRVALLSAGSSPPEAIRALIDGCGWCVCEPVDPADEDRPAAFRRFDVALMVDKGEVRPGKTGPRSLEQDWHWGHLQRFQMGVLIVTPRPWLFAGSGPGTVCLPPDASVEMVHGVLLALSHTRPVLRQIDKQLGSLRRLSETLRKQLEATDRELRLASRLQHDFLPREFPQEGPIRFRSIFRPCTWVSGDIYDVFRLDEQHWGFYIADAVGHGVAAGLLTMYIKHAIQPKRVNEGGYELVAPSQVMAMLNDQLAFQDLPDSQFITGWYGTINTETLELKYAVAGHPPPLLVETRRDGQIRELHGEGCLLGLHGGQDFSDESLMLRRGQRVMLYSDGLEQLLISHRPPLPQMPELGPEMADLLRLPGDEVIARLQERLDTAPGSLTHPDDVTVVLLDVVGDGSRSPSPDS